MLTPSATSGGRVGPLCRGSGANCNGDCSGSGTNRQRADAGFPFDPQVDKMLIMQRSASSLIRALYYVTNCHGLTVMVCRRLGTPRRFGRGRALLHTTANPAGEVGTRRSWRGLTPPAAVSLHRVGETPVAGIAALRLGGHGGLPVRYSTAGVDGPVLTRRRPRRPARPSSPSASSAAAAPSGAHGPPSGRARDGRSLLQPGAPGLRGLRHAPPQIQVLACACWLAPASTARRAPTSPPSAPRAPSPTAGGPPRAAAAPPARSRPPPPAAAHAWPPACGARPGPTAAPPGRPRPRCARRAPEASTRRR